MKTPAATSLAEIIGRSRPGRDGFVRIEVGKPEWTALAQGCAEGRHDLSALWFEAGRMRMALIDRAASTRAIVALACIKGAYPAVSRCHAPAIRLERAMHDLYGTKPQGLPDARPWLDHGRWPKRPDGRKPRPHGRYPFLAAEGEGLHQIPVGPVHAGIIEPGHFRFSANGETVVRLEERLGYTHKGIEALCVGLCPARAAKVIGRVSGDSTVAYAFAFARAIEAALGVEVPARAQILRGIMAELERLSHHVNDFGAICNDASAVALNARCTLLRENLLQAAARVFGHRLMMDAIIPGGVAVDLPEAEVAGLRQVLDEVETGLAQVVHVYDDSPSIQDRTVTTGVVSAELVRRFAAGGHVGRASGRDFDARRDLCYPPYDAVDFTVALRSEGDVNARVWIRIEEAGHSLAIIRQLLDKLEPGPLAAELPAKRASEGAALTEAFRGDVFVTVSLAADGTIAHAHARDASWFQWPLLEAAIEGNIVADFPLCNKSFNCSYSGHDI
jgi:Ni,Fe-hydrogenase III large subunit